MRYAIISDVHGNLEAFRAVLDALSGERIDAYLSIGDLVGYGADPKECIKFLKSLDPQVLIAGNHEWGIAGLADIESFSDLARHAVLWSRSALDKEETEYLKSFQLVYEDEKMTLVHGTLNMPEEFYYIFDSNDAYVTIRAMKSRLCFVAHTHVPAIFFSDNNRVDYIDGPRIRVDLGKKYVINAGSVGQPRDGDPRASYAIYDNKEATVEIKRVEYDVKRAQEKILRAGLPARFAYRLSEGR